MLIERLIADNMKKLELSKVTLAIKFAIRSANVLKSHSRKFLIFYVVPKLVQKVPQGTGNEWESQNLADTLGKDRIGAELGSDLLLIEKKTISLI